MADRARDDRPQLRPEVAEEGQSWSVRARDWAEVQESFLDPCYLRILDLTKLGPGDTVLDVGCGAGRFLELAFARGAGVVGLDAAPGMLEIAKLTNPQGTFRLGDMEDLPFGDGQFDLVTGFNSFSHADDPIRALRQARRVAGRQGRIALTVWGAPEPGSMREAVSELIHSVLTGEHHDDSRAEPEASGEAHVHSITAEDDLEAIVREAGLSPLEAGTVDCTFFYPDEATLLKGLMSPGPFVQAEKQVGEARLREAVLRAMQQFRTSSGGYSSVNKFRYLIASSANT